MSDFPHVQAAFINAIREEGTKAEACDWLQKTWNERCALAAEVEALRKQLDEARDLLKRVNPALNSAFAAGMEEREGGSARRQSRAMEPVEALRKETQTYLARIDAKPEASGPTEYETKVAQMKKDFPNGI